MSDKPLWSNIPKEMQALPQWCLAGKDKAPLMVSSSGALYNASPVVGPWLNFGDACQFAALHELNIGFIITENDPFTCIDFDVKDGQSIDRVTGEHLPRSKWTPMFALERYLAIMQSFDSYTELSTSLKGMHVWIRGKVGKGIKRDGVELYSQERFIVCTGIAVSEVHYSIFADIALACYPRIDIKPIEERQELLNRLAEEMRAGQGVKGDDDPLVEIDPVEPDEAIWKRAVNADNGAKFTQLCNGDWHGMGYPSQSEADLSLLSMFAFYTKSFSQIRRMFRQTGLGAREKSQKDDRYLDLTLLIIRNRIRAEEERKQRDVQISTAEVQKLIQQMQTERVQDLTSQAIASVEMPKSVGDGIDWPPGMVGALAAFIYHSSPRPVKEVSVVAALGLIAGIVGKAYTIPQSGLNLYLNLVARSAIGKEAMHSGIAIILDKLRNSIPGVERFVDFSDFASGQALTKACAENKSFVNITGEWGKRLRELSNEQARNSPAQGLRTVMTNLYQKSGPVSIVSGLKYSNKESNVASVSGVAYSMIGESTPRVFYESLTDTMMEDGFLSRFTTIEYEGDRPPLNENPVLMLDDRLYNALCSLVVQCLQMLENRRNTEVQFDGESTGLVRAFDKECDAQINSTDDERWRQMWNRAHLKVLRLSALLATADNFINPVVNRVHVDWTIDLIRRDIAITSRKLVEGDIGQGDGVRERKLIAVIKTFFTAKIPESYKIPQELVDQGIVPRKFLQVRTATLNQFTSHRLGATTALDLTLKSLIDSGYIMEVDRKVLADQYSFHGRCFRVLNLS